MSKYGSSYLLATLLGVLASHGLAAETLDPRRGWLAFKEFARAVDETPDPGISVQIDRVAGDRGDIHLFFSRQVLEPVDGRLEPVGAVVCEFVFGARHRQPMIWREWSFDHGTPAHFVDTVERHPVVAALFVSRPLWSGVYWDEA